MSSRNRTIALTAAAAGGVLAARRLRWRRALVGIDGAVTGGHDVDLPSERATASDEAHAAGHRHLPPVDRRPLGAGRDSRPAPSFAVGHRDRVPDR